MGWHQRCSIANKCRYGSETEPGTCGYTSCRLKHRFERANEGDITEHFSLVRDGLLPLHGSRRNKNGEVEYW